MKKKLLFRLIALILLLNISGYADSEIDVNVRIGKIYSSNMETAGYRIAFDIDIVSQEIDKVYCFALINQLAEIDKNRERDEYTIDMKADEKYEIVVFVTENQDGEYVSSRYLLIEIKEGILQTEWLQDNRLPRLS